MPEQWIFNYNLDYCQPGKPRKPDIDWLDYQRDLHLRLGLPVRRYMWEAEIDLQTTPKQLLQDLTQELRRICNSGEAALVWPTLTTDYQPDNDFEGWVILVPQFDLSINYGRMDMALPVVFSDHDWPRFHFCNVSTHKWLAVSESFKALYESREWRGLEFVPLNNFGHFVARNWFLPHPRFSLGWGADHPWVRPEADLAHYSEGVRTTDARLARWTFPWRERDPALTLDVEVEELLSVGNAEKTIVDAYPIVNRADLPTAADFAWIPVRGWRGDVHWRLCCTQRIKHELNQHGLLQGTKARYIFIRDEVAEETRHRGNVWVVQKPMIFADGLATYESIADKHNDVSSSMKLRCTSMSKILQLLRNREVLKPANLQLYPAAKEELIRDCERKMQIQVPACWRELLLLCNGLSFQRDTSDGSCIIDLHPVERFEAFGNTSHIENTAAEFPNGLMLVGHLDCTSYAFGLLTDLTTQDGDCPVVLTGRAESLPFEREWAGIPQFLDEALFALLPGTSMW